MIRLAVQFVTGVAVALLWGAVLMATDAVAQAPNGNPAADAAGNNAGPLPRYLSLRSDEVNLRTGPGVRYPVDWVLQRRNMPVEVLAQSDNWRKIRDWQGTEGWVHQSMLSGRRYALITGDTRPIHRQPAPDSPNVAKLEQGVIAQLIECKEQWCRVDANGFKGWLRRADFWGAYPNETVK
jgi:SH3-like domain-containing protein